MQKVVSSKKYQIIYFISDCDDGSCKYYLELQTSFMNNKKIELSKKEFDKAIEK